MIRYFASFFLGASVVEQNPWNLTPGLSAMNLGASNFSCCLSRRLCWNFSSLINLCCALISFLRLSSSELLLSSLCKKLRINSLLHSHSGKTIEHTEIVRLRPFLSLSENSSSKSGFSALVPWNKTHSRWFVNYTVSSKISYFDSLKLVFDKGLFDSFLSEFVQTRNGGIKQSNRERDLCLHPRQKNLV